MLKCSFHFLFSDITDIYIYIYGKRERETEEEENKYAVAGLICEFLPFANFRHQTTDDFVNFLFSACPALPCHTMYKFITQNERREVKQRWGEISIHHILVRSGSLSLMPVERDNPDTFNLTSALLRKPVAQTGEGQ